MTHSPPPAMTNFTAKIPLSCRALAYIVAVLVAVFAIHGNTITDTFLADDNRIVVEIRTGGPLARWTGPPDVFFRPLVSLLFAVDHSLYGLNPRGYHVTNLLLHAGITLWVVALASVLARQAGTTATSRRGLAALAGAIFLSHPSHSESVAWIAGRSDLLAAFFALGSVALYFRWRQRCDTTERPATRTRLASWLLLLAALASKEAAATLPGVIVILDLLGSPRHDRAWTGRLRAALARAWWHLATIPIYLVVRSLVLQQAIGGYGSAAHFRPDPLLLGEHFIAFLSRATLPRLGHAQISNLTFAAGVAVVVGACWIRYRNDSTSSLRGLAPLAFATLSAFAVAVVPALSMQVSRTSSSSERLIYLPSAFIAVTSAALLFVVVRDHRLRWVMAILIVGSLALGSVRGNLAWRAAATATDRTTDAILGIDTKDAIYLLTAPGAIDGAFALHNNLHSALILRATRKLGRPKRIGLIAPVRVRLPTLSAPVATVRRKAKYFTVATKDPRVTFQKRHQPLFRVSRWRPDGFRVDLPKLRRGDWVLAWSDGAVVVLKEGSTRP